MTPPTAPLCPHLSECHEHMRETTSIVATALKPIAEAIERIEAELGRKDRRLTRVETVLAVLGAVCVLGTTIGSCSISNGYFRVPPAKAALIHAPR